MASDLYTAQQLADMARRLDECIEISAVCMDLALAGEMQRQAIARMRTPGAQHPVAGHDERSGHHTGHCPTES